jgi:hypothetical protein
MEELSYALAIGELFLFQKLSISQSMCVDPLV